MGRKVFVSSDIAVDERLIDVASEDGKAALLWPWLLTAMDDWGRAEASPKRLKARIFPSNPLVTADDVAQAMALYARVGLMSIYEAGGKAYMAVREETWWRYQTHIHKSKREKDESKIPPPPRHEAIAESRETTRDDANSRDTARDRAEDREGARDRYASPLPPFLPSPSAPDGETHSVGADAPSGGRRRKVTVRQREPNPDFEAAWAGYPRRIGKGDARAAWDARGKSLDPSAAIAAVRNYARYCRDRPVDPQYVMHMSRFFGPKEPYLEWVQDIPEDEKRQLGAGMNGAANGAATHRRTGAFGAGTASAGGYGRNLAITDDADDEDVPEVRSGTSRAAP